MGKRKAEIEAIPYSRSGLDWVYLTNGYELEETAYGETYTIHDIDGLNDVITRTIVFSSMPIRGQELRFLRSWLGWSQAQLARHLGVTREHVAKKEARREEPISKTTTRLLRVVVAVEHMRRLEERIREIDEEIKRLKAKLFALVEQLGEQDDETINEHWFEEIQNGWQPLAA